MAVKVLIKRKFVNGTLKDAQEMLIQARTNAMGSQGYISSETLSSFDNPHRVIVVSMWETKADWDSYAKSSDRMDNERKFAEILETETQYECFEMGIKN